MSYLSQLENQYAILAQMENERQGKASLNQERKTCACKWQWAEDCPSYSSSVLCEAGRECLELTPEEDLLQTA